MLHRKDVVPHFIVTTLSGATVRYVDIWQRRFLVLLCLPGAAVEGTPRPAAPAADDTDETRAYAARVERLCASAEVETTCVSTHDTIPGIPNPGVVVADRYGEIAFIAGAASLADLTSAESLMEWLGYISIRCS